MKLEILPALSLFFFAPVFCGFFIWNDAKSMKCIWVQVWYTEVMVMWRKNAQKYWHTKKSKGKMPRNTETQKM